VVLAYCHDVYVEFLAANDTPLPKVLEQRAWVAPIRHAEADYLKPLKFGDPVEVCLVRAHLETSDGA
jgi:acyl-CoA thioesterase FadM